MPIPVDITSAPHIEWKAIREAVGDMVELACPDARIHREWVLEFDPQSGLGKVTSLLRKESGVDVGKAHAWVVGFNSTSLDRGPTGNFEFVGGDKFHYNLVLDIWGFFDYAGINNSWDVAEQEARRITATIFCNPTLGIENIFIARAEPPEFVQGDVVPFSEGENLIVMQGQMLVRVLEQPVV